MCCVCLRRLEDVASSFSARPHPHPHPTHALPPPLHPRSPIPSPKKVRRAAAKLLAALCSSQPLLLPHLFRSAAPALLARIASEREEAVRLDLLATAGALVAQAASSFRSSSSSDSSSDPDSVPGAGAGAGAGAADGNGHGGGGGGATGAAGALGLLRGVVPRLAKGLCGILSGRSHKCRSAATLLLRDLALALPQGDLAPHCKPILAKVGRVLADKGSGAAASLRVEALALLRSILATQPPSAVQPHLPRLLPHLAAAAQERYYKVSAEALRAIADAVRCMRPRGPPGPSGQSQQQQLLAPGDKGSLPGFPQHAAALQVAVADRLGASDMDQEVKEAALGAAGALLSETGDVLTGAGTGQLLSLVVDRLRNEATRLPAVRALAAAAGSKAVPAPALAAVLGPAVAELASFLRKASRPLRQGALTALEALLGGGHVAGAVGGAGMMEAVVAELVPIVAEASGGVAMGLLGLLEWLALRESPLFLCPLPSSSVLSCPARCLFLLPHSLLLKTPNAQTN